MNANPISIFVLLVYFSVIGINLRYGKEETFKDSEEWSGNTYLKVLIYDDFSSQKLYSGGFYIRKVLSRQLMRTGIPIYKIKQRKGSEKRDSASSKNDSLDFEVLNLGCKYYYKLPSDMNIDLLIDIQTKNSNSILESHIEYHNLKLYKNQLIILTIKMDSEGKINPSSSNFILADKDDKEEEKQCEEIE